MQWDSSFYEFTQDLQGEIAETALFIARESGETPPTPVPLLQLRRGRAESPAWFLVQAAEFEPEPLSVQRIRVRAAWSSPALVHAILDLLASEKWLDRRGTEYYLTAEGQSVLTQIRSRWPRLLPPLETRLQATNLRTLEALLKRVITACLECPTPPGNWSLAHSRRRAPDPDAPALVQIFHYCNDLNAFRDDSHSAPYQPYRVEAYVWEAFSFLRRGQAENASQLFDQLAHRGYAQEDYCAALEELVRRGWITSAEANYVVTEQGKAIHQTVEQLTDQYFYGPWSALSSDEQTALRRLLDQFNDELKQLRSPAQ